MLLQLAPRGHAPAAPQTTEPGLDVAAVYAEHANFIWKSLFRLGVPEADLPDVMQEVLLVVHRRRDTFDNTSRLTTWLFGICLRVTATARRTRRRRREQPIDEQAHAELPHDALSAEDLMMARDSKRRLNAALDSLEPEKRAVFVMFELEGLSCGDIAEQLGLPKGTVFSRLANARHVFLEALTRFDKIEQRRSLALGGQR
jgi:RNA polymerase sigma-70 factor (ECF subfamily)